MESLGVSSVEQLQAISSLLSPQQDDDEDFKEVTSGAQLGPGHIGPSPKRHKDVSTTYAKKNNKDIWSEDEVGSTYDYEDDPRPQPDYEVLLKQTVGTEDVFLGLNHKNPSSMCCDAVLVRIKLPDTKASDVTLDVTERFLDLRTPRFKLGLHLPRPVLGGEGGARFDARRGELDVTLITVNRP